MTTDNFTPHAIGQRVRTNSGTLGTIHSLPRRAAADIRGAATERERDMSPYTVKLDRGGFQVYRGHELDAHDA